MQKIWLISILFLLSCSEKNKTVFLEPVLPEQRALVMQSLVAGKMPLEMMNLESIATFADSTCQKFINSLPPDYFHDFLEVPEDWGHPEGLKIQVFYYGRKIPGKDVVLFQNGGPASDSHGSYEGLSGQDHYNDFSFIFMDQRGTGCSTAYPEDLSLRGVQRLLHYGSRAIVNDSEALRKKLLPVGTPWKVFGQSFGGRIVQRYLEIAPMGLVSAHSHGYSIMSNDYQWTALRLLSQKRVFQDYLKIYPNDEIQIFKIRKQIPDDQCFVSQATSVCGARVIDSLVLSLGFKSSWSTLHQWVENLLIKGEVLNPPVLKQLVQFYVFGIYANNFAAGSVISWNDFFADQPSLQFCEQPLALLQQMGEHPETWALNECRLMADIHDSRWDPVMAEFLKTQRGYSDPFHLSAIKSNLQARPNLKFFLYSGQADVFVPVETFQEEVAFLSPYVRYNNFPNSGHEGFLTEDKVWQDLAK